MKHLVKLILLNLILMCNSANALNVVEGWYGGLILGASSQPTVAFTYTFSYPIGDPAPTVVATQDGRLTYDVFGNIGLMAGYRFYSGFRAELEGNYNYVGYKKLAINILDPTLLTPPITEETITVTVRTPSHSTGIKMEGSTSSGLVFINGIYEFIQRDCEDNWVPYLGLGVGYGYINNSAKLFDNEVDVDSGVNGGNVSVNTSTPIAQAIIGISYFLDDFSAFALDARYIVSAKKVGYLTPTYEGIPDSYLVEQPGDIILTQSIGFSERLQIFSINLTFTGAFNCF